MLGKVFGGSFTESLASYDRRSSSWKTSQISFISELNQYSDRWPTSGMMRSGTLYPRQTSAPATSAKESGSWQWATPTAQCWKVATLVEILKSRGRQIGLHDQVKTWPTPTVCGNHNRKGASKTSGDGLATSVKMVDPARSGSLNPNWVEWLMGYPTGFTDLKGSAMLSCPKSLK